MKVSTLGKILGGVVVLLVAVVVAVYAILAGMDFNTYKPRIAEAVRDATGRDLTIAGDLNLRIGLSPSVAVEGVTLENAAWAGNPNMVEIDSFEARVNLLPLISGTVEVERLVLNGATIRLARNADGAVNFDFAPPPGDGQAPGEAAPAAPPEPAASGDGAVSLPVVRLVEIRDARVIYSDAVAGLERTARIDTLTIAGDSAADPLELVFEGGVDAVPVAFEGRIGAPEEMLAPTRPWPVGLSGELAGAAWSLEGTIAEPTAARGLDLAFIVEGEELGRLSELAALAAPGAAVPALGPYRVAASVTGDADGALALEGVDLEIGSEAIVRLVARGAIANLQQVAGLDLTVSAQGQSLANASDAAGAALPPIGPISLDARATGALQDAVVIESLAAKIGESDIGGTVRVSMRDGRPYVNAALTSERFALADVAPPGQGGAAGSGSAGTGSAGAGAPAPSDDGRVIPDMALPLDGLKAVDADVTLRMGSFVGPAGLSASDINATLSLANGDLRLAPASLVLGGGAVNADLRLNAAAATPTLDTELAVEALDLGQLLADMGVTDLIVGQLNLDVDLSGEGGDLRGLLASLDGSSGILMGEGRIRSQFLDVYLGGTTAFLSRLVAGERPEYTVVNCVVNNVSFADGVGTVEAGLFDIEYATIAASGRFDLGTESLDLTVDPQPKSATLTTAVPLTIGGTFANPTYGLDPAATARRAVGILGAIAFPPAAVVGLGELGASDDNPCVTGEAAGERQPSGAPATPAVPQTPEEALDAVREGVGGALRGLLGGN